MPLERAGRAEEVAKAARFLSGDDSSYINGQGIIVDGRLTEGWPN
ncbi:MAG: SDR family oxidoreductase [Aureliella sp.]